MISGAVAFFRWTATTSAEPEMSDEEAPEADDTATVAE
jgi:hypothetical protein